MSTGNQAPPRRKRVIAVVTTEAAGTVTGVHPDAETAEQRRLPGEELGKWSIILQPEESFHVPGEPAVSTPSFAAACKAAAAAGTEVLIRDRTGASAGRTLLQALSRRRPVPAPASVGSYVRTPENVQSGQLTRETRVELRRWILGFSGVEAVLHRLGDAGMLVCTADGVTEVPLGHFVVRGQSGRFRAYSPEAFARKFTPAGEEN